MKIWTFPRSASLLPPSLSRYLVGLILLVLALPPVGHIATLKTVELIRNMIMTAGALTAIVVFNIHCFAPLFAGAYLH